jgi:hypothetical protein
MKMMAQSVARRRMARGLVLLSILASVALPRGATAASQKDVFKSIQDSMGAPKETDSTPAYGLAAAGLVVLVIFVVANRRQEKVSSPTALNHPGKLMKEVMKEVSLKSGEVKQLKLLAEALEASSGETTNPLALILCPSLMARGLQGTKGKVDRKVIAQIVRKFRLNQPAKQ